MATRRPSRGGGGFGPVLRLPEFRALLGAQLLSLVGDRVAAVALSVLVFRQSGSPVLAAATYAATYLPWLVASPLLAPLADRLPRRSIMVVSDLARAGLVAVMVLPGLPVVALMGLLVVTVLITPAFSTARAALLPGVVGPERYVAASTVDRLSTQLAGVGGFAAGGLLLAAVGPRACLALDAATFLASAALVRLKVAERRAEPRPREGFWAEVTGGGRLVFADRFLTRLVVTAWVLAAVSAVPEGLAVTYAHEVHAGPVAVGLLTASWPLGAFVSVLLAGRWVPASRRLRILRPLAILGLVPLLVPVLHPTLPLVLACWAASGIASAYQLPANATFVQLVPDSHRGRALGLAQSGIFLGQGLLLLAAGAAAEHWPVSDVVAVIAAVALVLVAGLQVGWGNAERGVAAALPELAADPVAPLARSA